jgi:hypothetical protein
MAKIIVGLSRKRPGPEQYSSDGYHITVELEHFPQRLRQDRRRVRCS